MNNDDKTIAILTPITALVFGVLGPLVIWLVKKGDGDTFLVRTARETLNFQITVLLAGIAAWVLMFLLIGFLLLPIIGLYHFVMCIVGAVKASNGEEFRYPLTLRLIKE